MGRCRNHTANPTVTPTKEILLFPCFNLIGVSKIKSPFKFPCAACEPTNDFERFMIGEQWLKLEMMKVFE